MSDDEEPANSVAALRRAAQDIEDLALMVRRLSRSLRVANPDSGLPDRAMDLLRRKGLGGSPLRVE